MSELYNGLDPYVAPALNNMMQLLWQSQHVGLCVIDANNYFVTASPTLCRWLETPLKQLQRQEFTTYIELDDADKQTVLNMYQDMMSVDTETQPSVLPLKTANGGKLKVWVHSRVSHDAQAEPVCVVLVHKLDRFIGVEEAHYRSLIEQQSQFLVTRWRPQDVVLTFVNDAYAAFYGTTRAECVGQSMLTFILPEAQKPFLDKIARAVQQAETFSTEEYVCSDAGTWHWLRWINEPIVDASGHVQFFQGMGVDVTEQVLRDRALELNDKRYREISETGVESLYSYFYVPPNELVQQTLMDKDKPADSAQDSWQWERDWEPEASTKRLTGYSLAEIDALGGWPALVHPDDLEHFNNSRHNLVAGEQREAEYRLITKTGKVIWIESRLRITAADDRPGLRVYGSDRDISDYKQVELALRQAVDEQDVMLKEIHHRVNNNMQVISSLLALQSHNVSDPQVRASLAESRARIMAMADVHREIYESPRLAGINFADYLQHIVRRVRASNAHALQIDIECTSVLLGAEQAVPLGLIVNELMQDVFKRASQMPAAQPGAVTINLQCISEAEFADRQRAAGLTPELLQFTDARAKQPRQIMCLTLSDHCGPLETTDTEASGSDNLAMTIVQALSDQLAALLEFQPSQDGLTVVISCPVAAPYTKTDTSPFWRTHAGEQHNL